MDRKPYVTVIIPVFNCSNYISKCLDNILNQSYPKEKMEIIVVDNNSTDNTLEEINKYDLIVLSEYKKGPAAARNKGMKKARGEIIIFIDADCIASHNFVEEHVSAHKKNHGLQENEFYKIIGGGIKGKNENLWALCDDFCSWHAWNPSLPSDKRKFLPTANLSISGDIIYKEKLQFDEELLTGEDFAFCTMASKGKIPVYFEPNAVVSHVNRTSFESFLNHNKNWVRSEYLLRKKGLITVKKRNIPVLVLKYLIIYFLMIWEVIFNSLRAGRINVFLVLPFIIISKFNWWLTLLEVELRYQKYIRRKQKESMNITHINRIEDLSSKKIKASIIIPTKDKNYSLTFVLKALENQIFDDIEVIVVLDGCQKSTIEEIQELKVNYKPLFVVLDEGKGRSGARNEGIQKARGEIIIFIDDDRIPEEDFIQKHLEAHKNFAGVVIGERYNLKYDESEVEEMFLREDIPTNWDNFLSYSIKEKAEILRSLFLLGKHNPLRWNGFVTGNVSISRHILIDCGGFDENFKGWGWEDIELGYRIARLGYPFIKRNDINNFHIEHKHSSSNIKEDDSRNYGYFKTKITNDRSGRIVSFLTYSLRSFFYRFNQYY